MYTMNQYFIQGIKYYELINWNLAFIVSVGPANVIAVYVYPLFQFVNFPTFCKLQRLRIKVKFLIIDTKYNWSADIASL